jgi:hypothetical protein
MKRWSWEVDCGARLLIRFGSEPGAGRDRVLVPRPRDRSPKPRAFPDQGYQPEFDVQANETLYGAPSHELGVEKLSYRTPGLN